MAIEPVSVASPKDAREYLSRHVNALWLSSSMDSVRAHLASAGSSVKDAYKACMDSKDDLSKCMRSAASTQRLSVKYRSAWGESLTTA